MDRSFLSHPAVVAASREFICVRLATYESEFEAELLSSIYTGRSGELENTVFSILAPDGETELVQSGRSPGQAFGRDAQAAERMAEAMTRIADDYPVKDASVTSDVPTIADVRLALNVAACDDLPLVVSLDEGASRTLASLAWKGAYAGRFLYTSAEAADVEQLGALSASTAIAVVRPNEFGTSFDVLQEMERGASPATVRRSLDGVLTSFRTRDRSSPEHVQSGLQQGVEWQTEVPVTDPQALMANERARSRYAPMNGVERSTEAEAVSDTSDAADTAGASGSPVPVDASIGEAPGEPGRNRQRGRRPVREREAEANEQGRPGRRSGARRGRRGSESEPLGRPRGRPPGRDGERARPDRARGTRRPREAGEARGSGGDRPERGVRSGERRGQRGERTGRRPGAGPAARDKEMWEALQG